MKSIIKVKIYAKRSKTQLLKQSLGNVRFVWNKLLEKNREIYKKEKKFLFYSDMCNEITKMKEEYPFLKQSPSQTLQQIARKLDWSLRDAIKRKKGFPKFKKKSRYDGILIFPQGFKFEGRKLYLPSIGWVSIKDKITKKEEWDNIKRTAKQVWVKEDVDGFFAFIVYEREKEEKEKNGEAVGIDVGIKNTITMSNGEAISLDTGRIMSLVRKEERLQSIIDKKSAINEKRGIKRSKRIEKLERRRDKILKKIQNIKIDFYYKAINHIFNSHEYVVVEDLNLNELKEAEKGNRLVRRKVNKYLQHISLSEFFRILEWKGELYGREIIRVDPKDSSKTCSNCGYVNHGLKLSDRVFKCPICGMNMDRDLNASINILKRGLERIAPSTGHGEYRGEMVVIAKTTYTLNLRI